MEKYKLIKLYPGSPAVGTILVKKRNGWYELEHGTSWANTPDKIEQFPEFWEKLEYPVLITEDGIEIYDGQTCFTVFNNFKILPQDVFLGMKNYVGLKYFSTKKAAENYVRCNFPCMSFNDIWNMSKNKDSKNSYVVISKSDLKKFTQNLIFD